MYSKWSNQIITSDNFTDLCTAMSIKLSQYSPNNQYSQELTDDGKLTFINLHTVTSILL